MTIWRVIFWASVLTTLYIYFGYPLLVTVAGWLKRRPVRKHEALPTVSILIAAFNEEMHIGATIENKLVLDYPPDKVQIVVVSDGSSDRTDEIAAGYRTLHVVVLRQEPRNGKTSALNLGVRHCTGEVLVFADANSIYETGAIRAIARNFADPDVGYVTGRLAYVNSEGKMSGDGCTLYMRYENRLRQSETAVGSIVGVNGGIDAVRRCLYTPMHPEQLPDFVLPLRVVDRGYRVVYEPDAVLREDALKRSRDEYRMRVRVSLRAIWTLFEMRHMLNPLTHGIFAVQLWSHKALRYQALLLVLASVVSAAVLAGESVFFRVVLGFQAAFGLAAALGFVAELVGWTSRALLLPYYFVLVNTAALQALVKFCAGHRARVWKPRLG